MYCTVLFFIITDMYSKKTISIGEHTIPGFEIIPDNDIEYHITDPRNPQFYTHFVDYAHTDTEGFNYFIDLLRSYADAVAEKYSRPIDGYPIITIHSNTLLSLDDNGKNFIFDTEKATRILQIISHYPDIRFSFENIPFEHDLYTGARYCEEAYDPLVFLRSMGGVYGGILPDNIGVTFDTTHWMLGQLKLRNGKQGFIPHVAGEEMVEVIKKISEQKRLFAVHLSGYNGFLYRLFLGDGKVSRTVRKAFYEHTGVADYPEWFKLYQNIVPVNEVRAIVAEYGGNVPIIIETAPHWSMADFILDMKKSFQWYRDLRSQNSM